MIHSMDKKLLCPVFKDIALFFKVMLLVLTRVQMVNCGVGFWLDGVGLDRERGNLLVWGFGVFAGEFISLLAGFLNDR